jgi:hypothetical protein
MIGALISAGHYARGFHATGTIGAFGAAAACAHILNLDEATTARLRPCGLPGRGPQGAVRDDGQVAPRRPRIGDWPNLGDLGAGGNDRPSRHSRAPSGLRGHADRRRVDRRSALGRSCAGPQPVQIPRCLLWHARNAGGHRRSASPRFAARTGPSDPPEGRCRRRRHVQHRRAANRARSQVQPALQRRPRAARRGYIRCATYADSVVQRPELEASRAITTVELAPPGWPEDVTEVTIKTRDGDTFVQRHDISVPPGDIPMQGQRLRAKFMALATPVIGADRAEALADAIRRMEDQDDVSKLFALATPL